MDDLTTGNIITLVVSAVGFISGYAYLKSDVEALKRQSDYITGYVKDAVTDRDTTFETVKGKLIELDMTSKLKDQADKERDKKLDHVTVVTEAIQSDLAKHDKKLEKLMVIVEEALSK